MPAIRSLFSLVFPKVFGSTNRSKSDYANIEAKQGSSSQRSESNNLSQQSQGVRVSKMPNQTSAMELNDMRFHYPRQHSVEKPPVTPREPV